jgi:hypothetical protein
MKRILIPLTLLLGINSFYSQEVISSAGRIFSSNGINLSWSIGEVITATVDDGTTTLTQGYQQANLTISTIEEDITNLYSIYPNPTKNNFTIESGNQSSNTLTGMLYNMEGKLLKKIIISDIITVVYLDEIPQGIYLLKISENNQTNTYRIIKN